MRGLKEDAKHSKSFILGSFVWSEVETTFHRVGLEKSKKELDASIEKGISYVRKREEREFQGLWKNCVSLYLDWEIFESV